MCGSHYEPIRRRRCGRTMTPIKERGLGLGLGTPPSPKLNPTEMVCAPHGNSFKTVDATHEAD